MVLKFPTKIKVWLEEQGAWDPYITNLRVSIEEYSENRDNKLHIFQEFLDAGHIPGVILKSFHWAVTPEGHDFWSNIYKKSIDEFN